MSSTQITDAALKQRFKDMSRAFHSMGIVDAKTSVSVKDVLTSTDATIFLPKVVSTMVKEAVEPNLVITNLFQTIRLNSGRSIEFPAIGALEADEIGETASYPERELSVGSGNIVNIAISKVGVLVRISEEMIEDSQWDVINLHLRAAGKALARKKELKCLTLFNKMGQKIFDNVEPTSAVIGATTGRAIDGSFNGGLFLDDLFDMIAYLLNVGYNANTLIMHPLAWTMLAKDPYLREIAWMGLHQWWGGKTEGKVGETGWDDATNLRLHTTAPNLSDTRTAVPVSTFPMPLKVLVTPFVRFIPKGAIVYKQDGTLSGATTVTDAQSKALYPLTDFYVLDDSETGVIVEKDPVETEEFRDPLKDIKNLKIRERYGLGTLSQGRSIVAARNVAVTLTFAFHHNNMATNLPTPTRNS
jgi:hypothetical protein